MKVKNIIDEDFVNYKKPSMFIGFPRCSFKCDRDCGEKVCQNSALSLSKDIEIEVDEIVKRYCKNDITKAIVCGGLEPFDTFEDLFELINKIREKTSDDIVIYTGYYKEEISEYINKLKTYENIVIKFGRFKPNEEKHYDNILEVFLSSNNQYSERI